MYGAIIEPIAHLKESLYKEQQVLVKNAHLINFFHLFS